MTSTISLYNLSFQFNGGAVIFDRLSHRFLPGMHGIVGDNGSGKSALAGLVYGRYLPSSGTIIRPDSIGFLGQHHHLTQGTVAEFLGKQSALLSVRRVLSGDYHPQDLLLAEDNWQLEQQLNQSLLLAGIKTDLLQPVASLSGGEQTRLALFNLFQQSYDWLVLDEPGNHLDLTGQSWLRQKIANYRGSMLLISHHRNLLEVMPQIHQLSQKQLKVYGGNFSFYHHQQQEEQKALVRQITHQKGALNQIKAEQQKSIERAEKRAKSGKKLRRSGSQSKLLLDKMKNAAESRGSMSIRRNERKSEQLQAEICHGQKLLTVPKKLAMDIDTQKRKSSVAIRLNQLVLPFGDNHPITLNLHYGQRVWIKGDNGSGKSTLMKILSGELTALSGEVCLNGKVAYLDQHQSLLNNNGSAMNNLKSFAPGMTDCDYRTRLANIGFRGDYALKPVSSLSGGERVRLALLAVTTGNHPASILLLDESDNHLDLHAKQMLEQAIAEYRATLLVISHDISFIEQIDMTSELELRRSSIDLC